MNVLQYVFPIQPIGAKNFFHTELCQDEGNFSKFYLITESTHSGHLVSNSKINFNFYIQRSKFHIFEFKNNLEKKILELCFKKATAGHNYK